MTEGRLHRMVGEILYDLFEHGFISQPDEKKPDYGIGTKCITEIKNGIRLNLEESKEDFPPQVENFGQGECTCHIDDLTVCSKHFAE